ncbi:hypothetical protein BsWGS_00937 [Bradybaena similaris]
MGEDVGVSRCRTTAIFLLPYRIQRKRLEDIKHSMLKKNIPLANCLDDTVTHVVTEFESLEQVENQAAKDGFQLPREACIVSMKWLVECLKSSALVSVQDHHVLRKVEVVTSGCNEIRTYPEISEWACQRGAKLQHFNKNLTDALETLQLHAELRDGSQDYSRALAFRRASSLLKSLPFELQDPGQLAGVKDIGDHVLRVITETLDNGTCSEVEKIIHGEWFQQMKMFTAIFGVGPATAKSWITKGWRTIEDVRRAACPCSDWRINWGLAFHEDLTCPVSRQEADTFASIVQGTAEALLPGTVVTLAGGFRRGKQVGHDVDLLITHPSEGCELGLLPKLLSALAKRDLVLIGYKEKNSYRPDILYQDSKASIKGQFDHFEKWLGICKFPKSFQQSFTASLSNSAKDQHSSNSGKDQHSSNSARNQHSMNRAETIKGQLSENTLELSDAWKQEVERVDVQGQGYVNGDDSFPDMFEPRFKKSKVDERTDRQPAMIAKAEREWLARRVDLIVTPYSQYYFALFGWTGNKHFNRDARLYAKKVLGIKLTSHGMFDLKQQKSLEASSEDDIFRQLKLPYRHPVERNC